LVRRVRKLDLEPVVYTLTERGEPGRPPMDLAVADVLVDRYRLFLVLAGLNPERRLVPTRQIDAVWRVHVLDSGKYAADTEAVFDTGLHRFPYVGPDEEFGLLVDAVSTQPAGVWAVLGDRAGLLERPRPRREHPT
jgi:hypothetical protein